MTAPLAERSPYDRGEQVYQVTFEDRIFHVRETDLRTFYGEYNLLNNHGQLSRWAQKNVTVIPVTPMPGPDGTISYRTGNS